MTATLRNEEDYLLKFLRQSPVFYAFLRAIECRRMSAITFEPPVLDLGCGDGMFGNILFDGRQKSVDFGIDISRKDIRRAKETGVYQLLQVADICNLPFADATIGAIYSNSVFEHLPDIDGALFEAARVLKPGGKLVLTSPNDQLEDNFLFARFVRLLHFSAAARSVGKMGNRILGNSTCLSAQQWDQKLTRAGFSKIGKSTFAPPNIFHISEFFMPFSIFSALSKRMTGRLLFFKRRITLKPLHLLLRKYYLQDNHAPGLGTIIVAEKVATSGEK